ncbi:MAG: DUF3577 domain-containing protein [Gammaproteobacteria bacterium]|nr:DUF3577 domain-containing protein [Gammaproteobacteria bacterium]
MSIPQDDQQTQDQSKFYNLFGSGHAYVRRIREVAVKRADPFVACDLYALDNGQTRRFDVKVVGSEAEKQILQLKADVDKGVRVAIEYRISDIYAETYEDQNHAGQFKPSIKGRLLKVLWVGEGDIKEPAELTFNGLAYLNSVRTRQDSLAASLSALHGAADAVEYTPFDCVVERSLDETFRKFGSELEAKKRILLGFKSSGLSPRVFTYDKGDKQGQPGVSLGTTLREVRWAKVDGQEVIKAAA